jgi:hypothetical protein
MTTELADQLESTPTVEDGSTETTETNPDTDVEAVDEQVEPTPDESRQPDDTEQAPQDDGDTAEPDYTQTLTALDKADVTDARKEAFREAPIDEAFRALQREGLLPKEQLEDWAVNDPQAFLTAGIKAASKQTNIDRLGNKLHELETKATETAQTDESEPASESEELDEVWNELQEEYGESVTKLKDEFDRMVSGVTSALEEKLSQQSKMNDYLAERLERREMAEMREKLQETYPDLADAENFQKVVERTRKFVKAGEYTDLEEAFADATARELAPLSVKTIQQRMTQRSQNRRKGQPFNGTKSMDTARDVSNEDRERAIFNQLERKHKR